jgi:hypothetical protein
MLNLDPFQKTCEQDSVLPIVVKLAYPTYLKSENHYIYPFEIIYDDKTSTNYFKLTNPGIYDVYVNGFKENSIDPIYVIPKEVKPINSINKYLFDYRYAVK